MDLSQEVVMATKAGSISARDLPGMIDKAVGGAKGGDKLDKATILDWTIVGRILRDEAMSLKDAQQIATEVSRNVALPGAGAAASQLEPAVLAAHGRIICGFLPPPGVEIRF
jgi:hypothetical protein